MKDTKLSKILSTLSKKEFKDLGFFLQSPYFNKNEVFRQLWETLEAYHPDYDQVDKVAVVQQLYPGRSINRQFATDRLREMTLLVEQFLAQEQLKREPAVSLSLQLEVLKQKQLPKWYAQKFDKALETLVGQTPLHWKNSLELWQYYHHFHHYFTADRYAKADTNDIEPLQYLDDYYLLVKLRYYCNHMAQGLTYSQSYRVPFIESLMTELIQNPPQHPIVALYFHLTRIFTTLPEWNESLFETVRLAYLQQFAQLEEIDRYFLVITLINLANTQIHLQSDKYITQIFQLYQFAVEKDLFMHREELKDATFINICTVGSYCKAFDWTIAFIRSHQHLLAPETREPAVRFGQALLYFHDGQSEKAADLLRDFHPANIDYKIRIYSLHVRCLLELFLEDMTYYRSLYAAQRAFRIFLGRDKRLAPAKKQAYYNFIKAVQIIAELRQGAWDNPVERRHLADTIAALQPITAGGWLLGKAIL